MSWINNFETTAAEIAIDKKFDYVICGHIHKQQNRIVETEKGSVNYLNSGDWVENLTALEYVDKSWTIYQYEEKLAIQEQQEIEEEPVLNMNELMNKILVMS